MKHFRHVSVVLSMMIASQIISGCQSEDNSKEDLTTTTEWDKVETAHPAEVTIESISTFFDLAQRNKSPQTTVQRKNKTLGVFLDSFNIQDIKVHSKSTTSTEPSVYENTSIDEGSESGTRKTTLTLDYSTSEFQLVSIFDNYHDIDTSDIDACGDPDVTKQNGTLSCTGTVNPITNNINALSCTMNTVFTASDVVFAKNSSFSARDNDDDGKTEESYYNIAGVYEGETFAYIDTNETIWDDTVYEYSLMNKGKIYFNNLSEYLTIDSSFDISDKPYISGLCNDVAYSGTLYLRGKDDALVELNITAENTMSISIDSDNDGTWDAVETKTLVSSTDVPPSIAASWTHIGADLCEERYIFGSDGSFESYAASEIMTGTYIVGHKTENNRYPLTVSFETDNQLPDCSGSTASGAGQVGTLYFSIQDVSTITFYETDTSPESIMTFNKQ